MFETSDLCSSCRTGLESLQLDPLSPVCPYLEFFEDGICSAYVPVEESKSISADNNNAE